MPIFSVEGPFNSKDVERIFHDLTTNDYYNESYNAQITIPDAYTAMADVLFGVFRLAAGAKTYDIGSGKGHLVSALIRKGADATGIEFNASMIESVLREDREHFVLVNSLRDVDLSPCDLLTSMEVFEHLPMSVTVANLSYIRKVFAGPVFLTIPSSGHDRTLPRLGHVEVDEHRLAAMAQNVVCPYIVMEDGHPSGGHITLAGYRWWEDFFLTQGFARQVTLEREYGRFVPGLLTQGLMWCCYVLRSLEPDSIAFGRGWYEQEGSFRWNGPDAELQFVTERERFSLQCDFTLPDANVMIDARLDYTVEQLDIVDDYRVAAQVVASGGVDLNGPDRRCVWQVPIAREPPTSPPGPFPGEDGALKRFRAYKVRLHTPLFIPAEHADGPDGRRLGFCFHEVRIVSP